jgi:AraC-like DNA-binding protein
LEAGGDFWYFCRMAAAGTEWDPRAFFRRVGDGGALGALFEHLPDVYLFVKDAAHRFTMMSPATWRLHGCSSEAEMLGKTDADFHPPVMARQYVEEDRRVMSTGRPLVDQVWLVTGADDVPRWFLSTKVPLRDRSGRVIGLAGVMRPYAAAGRAPREYHRLLPAIEHVLAHFGDPVRIADLARLTRLSVSQLQREFMRLFGMSPRDYLFQVRLQAACRLLESTLHPLGQIALDCGFYDQSHFVKRFAAATGVRPLEYRRRFSARAGRAR